MREPELCEPKIHFIDEKYSYLVHIIQVHVFFLFIKRRTTERLKTEEDIALQLNAHKKLTKFNLKLLP